MVENAEYPENLFFNERKVNNCELARNEMKALANSIKVLDKTVRELHRELIMLKNDVPTK
jgi:hypothetical protein